MSFLPFINHNVHLTEQASCYILLVFFMFLDILS